MDGTERAGHRQLTAGGHDLVGERGDQPDRHVDVAQPAAGVEPPERPGGLEHRRPVMAGHLLGQRRGQLPPAHDGRAHGVAGGPGRARPSDEGGAAGGGEQRPVAVAVAEVGRRRTQHESGHPPAMAAPDELADRATHRVADDDGRSRPELVEERGDVVGAGLQREALVAAETASVAAVIERDDVGVLAERLVGERPVEVGGGGPAMEEHDRRPAGPGVNFAHERRAPSRQRHGPAGREEHLGVGVRSHTSSESPPRSRIRAATAHPAATATPWNVQPMNFGSPLA